MIYFLKIKKKLEVVDREKLKTKILQKYKIQ